MDFFETFWTWFNAQLSTYIGDNTERVALALGPVIGVLGLIYIIIWGYLHLLGKVDEPFTTGLKRIITLVVVFQLSMSTLLYNPLIVDTFYTAPAQFASAVVGAGDPVRVIDTIWAQGSIVAEKIQDNATNPINWLGFHLTAFFVSLVVGVLCLYTTFLLALSKVALAVLLALGPLFIILFLFEATRHYFTAWIAQLSNYALTTILTIMVCTLFLQVVQTYATETAASGDAIFTADAFNMLLMCGLAQLFMMQVPQIAASLSGGGTALNTFGAFTATPRAIGRAGVRTTQFSMGLFSKRGYSAKERDMMSKARITGNRFGQFLRRLRPNTIKPVN